MHTDVGQLIGTLQYMSPEQCLADSDNIDVRSDVYALGVVLYELLCRKLPYDVAHLPVPAASRVVCEQHPTRPSGIDRTLQGDLQTILLKTLEKDPGRRFPSALGLGQDIRRYLNGEAVLARSPSVAYQLWVLARRNKALFGAISALFVALTGGIALSTALYFNAEAARVQTAAQRDLVRLSHFSRIA